MDGAEMRRETRVACVGIGVHSLDLQVWPTVILGFGAWVMGNREGQMALCPLLVFRVLMEKVEQMIMNARRVLHSLDFVVVD